VIAYHAMLDVPRELAQYISRLLNVERRRRGTRKNSRALTCFRQAVQGLRWFRQDLWYSGKAHEHGGNVQALCGPDGFPLWVADVELGARPDRGA
jgi:hypothetical protein